MSSAELNSLSVDELIAQVGVAKAIGTKHVAGLIFTYRCTIACKHCLFMCSPRQPDICMSLEDGLKFLRQLRSTDRVVHIAGGEPMMYYRQMLEICKAASSEGYAPHFFETNASWCTTDKVTNERYEELKNAGVLGVYISADPYHQEFVPPESRLRAYKLAVEIFSQENVAAANFSYEKLSEFRDIGRNREKLVEYSINSGIKLVGRAGDEFAHFKSDRPLESLVEDSDWRGRSMSKNCQQEFDSDGMWEIHIDPYGNIQTCCGIVVGNAHEKPLIEWMEKGFHNENDLVKMVCEDGPYGYLELARQYGYKVRQGYPQKCNLCWEVRKFLRPHYPETFGPAEIYE